MDSSALSQPCAFKLVYEPEDHYVNDHCLVKADDGLWHLFYIYFPRDRRRSAGGLLEYGIGHAQSPDLLEWSFVDVCLREGCDTWEEEAIYAPCVHRTPDARYVMLYCGTHKGSQQIGAATSQDLYTWTKYEKNPVITPCSAWSNWRSEGYHSCRDPHILEISPGEFICYYTANTLDPEVCCIAACRSANLLDWEDRGPVHTAPVNYSGPGQTRMESAGVNAIATEAGSKYALHFTHKYGVSVVTSYDPLHFQGPARVIGAYHASEIFRRPEDGTYFITSCCNNIGELHVPAKRDDYEPDHHGMFLAGVVWLDDYPAVVDLKRCLAQQPVGEQAE